MGMKKIGGDRKKMTKVTLMKNYRRLKSIQYKGKTITFRKYPPRSFDKKINTAVVGAYIHGVLYAAAPTKAEVIKKVKVDVDRYFKK